MVTTSTRGGAIRHKLSRDELLALIDKEAHARLGMSGNEFITKLKGGALPETLAKRDIQMLVRLLDA